MSSMHNIHGLMEELGYPVYNSTEWRLSIGSSKRSLNCDFFHNDNLFSAVPVGHSVCEEDIKRVIAIS
ncbi:hypothetical protein ILUMI_15005 [Ignelater luminosus]|uniref:Uncharacterized protein n=1 Tax=Ignelater luminosus TaxID=2038154 RepID=A0A8K0CUZ0_IGNLU|nr:hypothetical protein ILUMI_15005 [Ignelater luminosus]